VGHVCKAALADQRRLGPRGHSSEAASSCAPSAMHRHRKGGPCGLTCLFAAVVPSRQSAAVVTSA
jgi:hypothetical protein